MGLGLISRLWNFPTFPRSKLSDDVFELDRPSHLESGYIEMSYRLCLEIKSYFEFVSANHRTIPRALHNVCKWELFPSQIACVSTISHLHHHVDSQITTSQMETEDGVGYSLSLIDGNNV